MKTLSKNSFVRYSLLMSFFYISLPVLSQTTTLTPGIDNVVPPSPNVSALNKFGNIPVGQSTGVPDINIPIYSWSGKNFGKSVSISLNHHNSGVKVDEMASNVGIGWALNAGGVISRTVRGVYDELPGDGFLDKQLPTSAYEGNTRDVPNNERTFYKMNAGLVDTQNDIFNYNFNGQSGRFVLGKHGDILFLEQTKIKVEKFITTIQGKPLFSKFIITDEYGYRYVFEDYETSYKIGGGGCCSIYTSAWYLSRIFNPTNNDSVEFQYEDTNFRNEYSSGVTTALPLFADGFTNVATMGGGSAQDISGKRIKKINFPDGNAVDFLYNPSERLDLARDYLLQKIKVSKGDAVYGYVLNQDYSLSGRATLLSVTPIGGISETPDKPYVFEYVMHPSIPAKFSPQQDHWGYANFNTGSPVPHEYFRAPGGKYNPWREFEGGNRDTDPVRVKAGSLSKVTYPTGGYTVYDMEPNTAKDNWLEQNETVTITSPPFTDKELNEPLNSDIYPAANIPFVFEGEGNTTTAFAITINPLGGTCSSSCAIKFEIYNSSNDLVTSEQINFADPSPDPYQITRNFNLIGLVKGQTYYIKAYTINVTGYYDYVKISRREINAGTSSTVQLTHVQPFVGGLRIKKIADSDGIGSEPTQTREYDYVSEDGVTSSGSLGFRPVYTYLVYYDYKVNLPFFEQPGYHGNFNYNYAIRTTSSVNEIAYANGSPVTYKRVSEKTIANGVNLGKTVRYFSNFSDSPPIVQDVFPSVPTQFSSHAYGLLQKEEVYNASGQILRKIENAYSLPIDEYASNPIRVENFRSISIAPVKYLWSGNPNTPQISPDSDPHYFLMSSFTPTAGRSELTQTVSTNYEPGKPELVTVTNNAYDPIDFNLKETIVATSKNETRKTIIEYAKDKFDSPNGQLFSAMYGKNMIKNVIGEKQLLNGSELAAQWKDYSSWSPELYAPSGIYTQKQGYEKELRIRFLNYDLHGTLVSLMQENGVPMCYVWGYGGDYLLAKVSNADYASVVAALGGTQSVEDLRNSRSPSDAVVESTINALRNLPSAQVESFTYNTLFGITSHIDIKGERTTYEYDDFGRLKRIKDQKGNILKESTYHYKN